jgi:hypothetical protein
VKTQKRLLRMEIPHPDHRSLRGVVEKEVKDPNEVGTILREAGKLIDPASAIEWSLEGVAAEDLSEGRSLRHEFTRGTVTRATDGTVALAITDLLPLGLTAQFFEVIHNQLDMEGDDDSDDTPLEVPSFIVTQNDGTVN